MRLKGMFTLEASYVVPLFTIIMVVLVQLLLFLHDKAVWNSVAVKMNMRAEFENVGQIGLEEFERIANEYLAKRLVLDAEYLDIEENTLIKENNMIQFVRITKAAIGKKEEAND